MRKFLSVLLVALMLTATLAALPVAATTTEFEKSKIDGTTVADAEALSLVVTEYMANTTCAFGRNNTYDAFQYIEIYNRGTESVDLYDLAIVRGTNRNSTSVWNTDHKFEAKLSLQPGSIYTDTAASNTTYECVNPATAVLQPGEFAIIWFWNDSTRSASSSYGRSLGAPVVNNAGKTVYHHYFRQHYRAQNPAAASTITDDLLIVAAYAGSSSDFTNKPTFSLNTSGSYMYALVKDTDNSFDYKTQMAYEPIRNVTTGELYHGEYNKNILCLWQWGTLTKLSIPQYSSSFEGKASVYVPANCVPDYRNAARSANREGGCEAKQNYYELGIVDGFKEVGLVNFMEEATIGTMDAWQWAYVDPDRAPDAAKALATGDNTWQEMAIADHISANLRVGVDVPERPEVKIEIEGVGVQLEGDTLPTMNASVAQSTPAVSSTESVNDAVETWNIEILFAVACVLAFGGAGYAWRKKRVK